jgi:hypothetical protein
MTRTAKPAAKQCIDHVAADETGSASDNRSGLSAHAAFNCLSRRTL